jgi:UDP-glucose 4-epimerase
MKIAILGASGFIGKVIYNFLESNKYNVITFGRSIDSDFFLDLNNPESIRSAITISRPNILIHIASPSVQGIYRNSNKLNTDWAEKIMSAEIIGSSILFKECKDIGVEKIIYLSSAAIYGQNKNNLPFNEDMLPNPNTLYGAIKLSVEQIGITLFPNLISLRLFQVFGIGDSPNRLVPFILNSKENDQIDLTPCTQISDLIYVNDVAECVAELIKSNIKNGIFNLGTGIPIKLKDVVKEILKIKKSRITPNFNAKIFTGTEVMYSYADMNKMYNIIPWRPKYDFKTAIKEIINKQI